jgi:prevent-host-death family protein
MLKVLMRKSRPSQDIRPLSEFRANVATFIEQVRATGRPLVLTQHGRSAAILLAVEEYEALIERAELAEDVRTAEAQIAAGQGVAHGRALATVRARLGKPAGARRSA